MGASSSKAGRSAQRSAKPKPRGKPFEKGNKHRWPKGTSGNPTGVGGVRRPLQDAVIAFYEKHPELLGQIVERLHNEVMGKRRKSGERVLSAVAVAAFRELARKVDREHVRDTGDEGRKVLEGITLEISEGRGPERAKISIEARQPKVDSSLEITFENGAPPIGNGHEHENGEPHA